MFSHRPDVTVDETAAPSAIFRLNSTARGQRLWRRCATFSPQAVENPVGAAEIEKTLFGESRLAARTCCAPGNVST
jgi:hypothetical protein